MLSQCLSQRDTYLLLCSPLHTIYTNRTEVCVSAGAKDPETTFSERTRTRRGQMVLVAALPSDSLTAFLCGSR